MIFKFDLKELAAAMVRKREKEDITIATACKQTKLSTGGYFALESAASVNLTVPSLLKVCNWLNIHPSEFFEKSGKSIKQVNAKKPAKPKAKKPAKPKAVPPVKTAANE